MAIYFETYCIFGQYEWSLVKYPRLFHDAEILGRKSRTVTRSNGVETSWLAAGWPVDTKRYVTQVPNDISGRREDDLSLQFPLSLNFSFQIHPVSRRRFSEETVQTIARKGYFPRQPLSENFIFSFHRQQIFSI